MRIKPFTDNGNIAAIYRSEVAELRNFNNSSWITTDNNSDSHYRTDSSVFNSNYNTIRDTSESTESTVNNTSQISNDDVEAVCNAQYRWNIKNDVNFLKSRVDIQTINLEAQAIAAFTPTRSERFWDINVSAPTTPNQESAFEHSEPDEMSERSLGPVPRGIVNPNYPGFQHLAHTLQDYCLSIDNYYPSENEMTDDDLDIDITDSTYVQKPVRTEISTENKNNNNNNLFQTELEEQTIIFSQNDSLMKTEICETLNEIPDLLKTVTKSQNKTNHSTDLEINCSATDIENNFHAKDIIGDFNKEIEDEIRTLLNYNINIQDDLEELRKDIKDTFAKPIENTINNISDVVNHVIKKLVETQSESTDTNENTLKTTDVDKEVAAEIQEMNLENEANIRTEKNLSRPTFLLLESNIDSKITDAFLSDGKDEIMIYENEYDTANMAYTVERTIHQLSTEIRKIIPKLDEMRERDRLWAENTKESTSVTIDRNSNEVANTSTCFNTTTNMECDTKLKKNFITPDEAHVPKLNKAYNRTESRTIRKRQKEPSTSSSYRSAQSNTSVRENESTRECELGIFDVYNIETALPTIDIDAIENHIKAAKEAERRKRNDREEIRKRLAMGVDAEEYYSLGHADRPGKKPSLHSRLQSGKNLQICYMNETASDNESQASDMERSLNNSHKNLSQSSIFSKNNFNHPYQTRPLSVNITKQDKISTVQSLAKLRPPSMSSKTAKSRSSHSLGHIELKESDFYALQTTLQTEARIALAQAKELARIQMERERRCRAVSPVTEMLRRSMEKASAPLAADRRRVSRQLLTEMNVAQLQVIVNELHSQIESLNEGLVKLLMERDELHMGQDSMLVDIEDLTRYLGVKDQSKKTKGTKSAVRRLTSVVQK